MGELKINKTKEKGQALFDLPFLKKLKNVKNAEVIIACILGVIILLIYFSGFTTSKSSEENVLNSDYMSSMEYATVLENKLNKTLSAIAGAGEVKVMVTLENGPELVIATSTDKKTNSSESGTNKTQTVTVVENPVIVTQNGTSKPLVLMEILPKVKGVIVVSEGAGNIKVKLDLLNAIEALLSISPSNIQIFASK
jgi:stage III sporulation protein AG